MLSERRNLSIHALTRNSKRKRDLRVIALQRKGLIYLDVRCVTDTSNA